MSIVLNDNWFMNLAIEEAFKAYKMGEVPVGCIIVNEEGTVTAKTHNLKEKTQHVVDHAEILALTASNKIKNNWRLDGHTVYVTLEPCPMCLFALLHARVKRVVFGAYDAKAGSISLGYDFSNDKRFNHSFEVVGGLSHFECSKILSTFFRERRQEYKQIKS